MWIKYIEDGAPIMLNLDQVSKFSLGDVTSAKNIIVFYGQPTNDPETGGIDLPMLDMLEFETDAKAGEAFDLIVNLLAEGALYISLDYGFTTNYKSENTNYN